MAHLMDMNYFVNAEKYPLQFNVVESILKTVHDELPVALSEPENYKARAALLWATSWALNSFCTSGFKTLPSLHALEQLSSSYDLTHGLGLGLLAPKWMQFLLNFGPSVAEDFARFGTNVLGLEKEENINHLHRRLSMLSRTTSLMNCIFLPICLNLESMIPVLKKWLKKPAMEDLL